MLDDIDFLALIDPRQGRLELDVPTRPLSLPVRAPAMAWLHLRVPPALRGFDGIFHSPFNLLPFRMPVPSVVTVHDISFETHPHLFPWAKAVAFRSNASWAVRHAEQVTTVSHWARSQIIDRYAVDPDRIHVVPNGVGPEFRPLAKEDAEAWEAVLRRYRVTTPYVIAVGGVPRRGLEITIAAWRQLRAGGLPHGLVVLDNDGPPDSEVAWVPIPSQSDLRLLLAGADVLLYPTETESFGLPAIEAAACGTPVVCPPIDALPEVLGDAGIWCDRNAEALAGAARSVLDDPARLDEFSRRGRQAAARWSWDSAAAKLLDVYATVAAVRTD